MAALFNTHTQNSNVYNAQGNQYIGYPTNTPGAPFLREGLSRVPHAGFDPLKGCLDGTREEIIKAVMGWALSSTTPVVCWVRGQAGMGKSTISHSVADGLNELQCLIGSFFFSRAVQSQNNAEQLFSTIAYQMCSDLVLAEDIHVALEKNPDFARPGCSLLRQYQGLIRDPVDHRTQVDGRIKHMVIVLDALDECGTERERSGLLDIIRRQSGWLTGVKFFITSRPEPDISQVLSSSTLSQILDLSTFQTDIVDSYRDIATFVTERMARTAASHYLAASDEDPWPGQRLRESLVQKAGGLFIWASTACEFIHDEDTRSPDGRLKLVLGRGRDVSSTEPWVALDALYLQVLCAAVAGKDPNGMSVLIVDILGAVVMAVNPLSCSSLSSILRVGTPNDIQRRLRKLHAVLTVPAGVQELVQIIHPSFPDFLTNPSRCTDTRFCVEPALYHELLARKCILLMQRQKQLRRDICKLGYAPRHNSVIEEQRINDCIPADLRYACTSWAEHLHGFSRGSSRLRTLVEEFMFEHLLHWLEVLSLLGVFDSAVTLLGKVNEWIKRNDGGQPTELRSLLEDSLKFVREFHAPISASASQIYISALPFTPRSSMLYRKFTVRYGNTARIVRGACENWPPCLTIGCEEDIISLAFSADGSRAICGCKDALRVYDVNVGTMVCLPMRGHTDVIISVAFTPNGRHILSGAADGSVRLWDTYTSSQIGVFHVEQNHVISQLVWIDNGPGIRVLSSLSFHNDKDRAIVRNGDGDPHYGDVLVQITSMDLASDNSHFMLASMTQKSLGLEAFQCQKRRRWLGYGGYTSYVAPYLILSPCGSYVAGVSANTIYVWDAETVAAIDRGSTMVEHVHAIAFSPDGKWILSIGESEFKVWDWRTGSIVHKFSSPYPASLDPTVVALSPRGDVMFFSSCSNICAWNIGEGSLAAKPREEYGKTRAIAVSPDGSQMISAAGYKTLRVWDLQGPGIAEWRGHQSTGPSVLSPYPDRTIELNPHQESSAIIMSPDGTQFATIFTEPYSTKSPLYIGRWSRPDVIMTTSGDDDWHPIAFSPDGSHIAYRFSDESVVVWNLATDTKIEIGWSYNGLFDEMSFSPDGKRLVNSDWTWDLEHDIYTKFRHPFESGGWALSPSGSALAIGTDSGLIYVCNSETGTITSGPLKGHTDGVYSISWSPNEDHVVSASDDRTIRVWDLEKQSHTSLPRKGRNWVDSVSYSPDGRWIIARLWNDAEWFVWDAHTLSPADLTGLDPLSRRCDQNTSFLWLKPDGWVVDLGNNPILWVPVGNRKQSAVHRSSRLILGGKDGVILVDISEIAC